MENNINEFPRKSPASLTAARFKRVQDFRIVSARDPELYGRIGSPKWGDELHRFLADKRIAREDVERWIETNAQVTGPLPKKRKLEPHTENEPEQLLNFRGRALGTRRHPEVIQIQRPPSASSSSFSTDSQQSGDTVVSAMNPNYDASTNPISLNDAATPASGLNVQESSGLNVQESSGILNISTASQTSQSETQNDSIALNLLLREIAQQPEGSPREVILKDMAIGFGALYGLVQLSQKYEQFNRPFFLRTIHNIYKKLKEFQEINVGTQAVDEMEENITVTRAAISDSQQHLN